MPVDGYGAVIDYAEFEADDGLTYTGHLFNSVSSVTTAAGETFTGGGIAYAIHGTDGAGYEVTSFGTSSDFDWTGPDAADNWLRADAELDFEATQVTGEGFPAVRCGRDHRQPERGTGSGLQRSRSRRPPGGPGGMCARAQRCSGCADQRRTLV